MTKTRACERIWSAVMMSAVEDYYSTNRANRETSRQWIRSDSDRLASFLWVCVVLDINPTEIRKRLKRGRVKVPKRYALYRSMVEDEIAIQGA